MPYSTEIPVAVILHRGLWNGIVVSTVCDFLTAAFRGSYLNTVWWFTTVCSAGAAADSEYILTAALWLRYNGSLWDDPQLSFYSPCNLPTMLTNALSTKATRLAAAVVAVGYNPSGIDNDIENANLELLRFLCQGPWPKKPCLWYQLRFQLEYCFRLLVIEAREGRDVQAARDLWRMEMVFVKAYEILELGDWPYVSDKIFYGKPTGTVKLSDIVGEEPGLLDGLALNGYLRGHSVP
jgi:hypothetical protein